MGLSKNEKSFKGLQRKYNIDYRNIQKITERFLGVRRIVNSSQYEVADALATVLASSQNMKDAISKVEASRHLIDFIQARKEEVAAGSGGSDELVVEESGHSPISTSDGGRVIDAVQSLSRQVMELNKRIEELSSNKSVKDALSSKSPTEEMKKNLFGMAFALHYSLGFKVNKESVYSNVQSLVGEYGPGPFVAGVQAVYSYNEYMTSKGESIYKKWDGVFALLRVKTEEAWKSGHYSNPREVMMLLNMNPEYSASIDQPVFGEKSLDLGEESRKDFISSLMSGITPQKYTSLNVRTYCQAIINSDTIRGRNDIDFTSLFEVADKFIKSDIAMNEISCEIDIPFSYEDFILKDGEHAQ